MTHLERFEMWFADPLEFLEHKKTLTPSVRHKMFDGAFMAMSLGLFLFERYYRVKSGTHDAEPDPRPGDWDSRFKRCASIDLNIDYDFLEAFWSVFRNGIQHQGMPRRVLRGYKKKGKVWHLWDIDGDYPALPHVHWKPTGEMVICINPWKFASFMVNRLKNEHRILQEGFEHAFGDISAGKITAYYEVIPKHSIAVNSGYSKK